MSATFAAMMTEQELREWFTGRELPQGPVQISKSTTISDLKAGVEAQLYVLENTPSKTVREARIFDLVQIKEWLERKQK